MNCTQSEQWISRSLDGELPPDQTAMLNEHLERCAACRRVREQWMASAHLLKDRQVSPSQTPEAAWADVQRTLRIQGEAKAPKIPAFFGWPLQAAGIMLMLVVLGIGTVLLKRAPTALMKTSVPKGEETVVEMVEAGMPGASTLVYEDSDTGMMVIWLLPSDEKEKKHADS